MPRHHTAPLTSVAIIALAVSLVIGIVSGVVANLPRRAVPSFLNDSYGFHPVILKSLDDLPKPKTVRRIGF